MVIDDFQGRKYVQLQLPPKLAYFTSPKNKPEQQGSLYRHCKLHTHYYRGNPSKSLYICNVWSIPNRRCSMYSVFTYIYPPKLPKCRVSRPAPLSIWVPWVPLNPTTTGPSTQATACHRPGRQIAVSVAMYIRLTSRLHPCRMGQNAAEIVDGFATKVERFFFHLKRLEKIMSHHFKNVDSNFFFF